MAISFIILMGGPGAGKGTQTKRLEKALNIPQVASGDLFREHLKRKSVLGELARACIDVGDLVPDEITIAMVTNRLKNDDCSKGAILDGFPRTIRQADALEAFNTEIGALISVVPYIHVDPEILLKRLSGRWTCKQCGHVYHSLFKPPAEPGICDYDGSELYQRGDDTVETQQRRIEVYLEQTAPLLAYYKEKGLLAEINGEQSIEEVYQDLIAVIRDAERAIASLN